MGKKSTSKNNVKDTQQKKTDKKPIEKKQKEGGAFREYGELFAEVLIFVFFINAFLLQTYVIPSGSMEETMLIGDHLLVDKVKYSKALNNTDHFFFPQTDIKRGMIITFYGPHEINHQKEPKNLVKRVIALPGENIRVDGKKVYINGKLIDEPYAVFKKYPTRGVFPPDNHYGWRDFPYRFRDSIVKTPNGNAFVVPEGHYFCMGDNRNNSSDSRSWGPVPKQYVIGSPWRIYWSYESTAVEYKGTGLGHKIKDFFRTVVNFFSKTRWKRTLKKY